MIVKTMYICEFCGTEYETSAQAENCEAIHHETTEIDGKEWMFGKKYPDKLTVVMDDGAECQYHYFRETKGPSDV